MDRNGDLWHYIRPLLQQSTDMIRDVPLIEGFKENGRRKGRKGEMIDAFLSPPSSTTLAVLSNDIKSFEVGSVDVLSRRHESGVTGEAEGMDARDTVV